MVPRARRGEVTVEELPLPSTQQAEPAFEELSAKWETAVLESAKSGKKPSLLKVRRLRRRRRTDLRRRIEAANSRMHAPRWHRVPCMHVAWGPPTPAYHCPQCRRRAWGR